MGDAVGIERFDRVVFFTDADELHRLADDLLDRKCRTAAGVAVHFGQDDAGDADTLVENLCRPHGVLAGHCVGNEKNFDGPGLGLDLLKLDHQLVVYMKTAGRVDHQRVKTHLLRVLHSTAHQGHGVVRFLVLKDRNTDRSADYPQLFAGSGTINVDRNEQRLSLLVVAQPA